MMIAAFQILFHCLWCSIILSELFLTAREKKKSRVSLEGNQGIVLELEQTRGFVDAPLAWLFWAG